MFIFGRLNQIPKLDHMARKNVGPSNDSVQLVNISPTATVYGTYKTYNLLVNSIHVFFVNQQTHVGGATCL
jgi:gamma-glutamyl-gamma-aminobutyrate hydrolase PuuD